MPIINRSRRHPRFTTRPAVGFGAGLALLLLVGSTWADVRLAGLFSDNMVLQQGRPVPVWGWAEADEEISVQFRDHTASARAKEGRWMIELPPLKHGAPAEFQVRGKKNTLVLTNVVVGEVWICSGQSNMEWPLQRTHEPDSAIQASANPELRLFTVPKVKSDHPVDDVSGQWTEANPETTPGFSAVGYFFGRSLQKALDVPVGLIHTSWGGSPAEVWVREEILQAAPAYREEILNGYQAAMTNYEKAMAEYEDEKAKALKEGRAFDRKPPRKPFWRPSELYNGMIAPLIPFAIRGAIWYQGESNASRAAQYRRLFPDMIANWRYDWRQGDFPFLAVQLAPWDKNRKRPLDEITATPVESDWAELREAQVHATRVLPSVGLAVITDVGDKDDIHPTRKEPVGERLALLARGIAYAEDIAHWGPLYRNMTIEGNRAVVRFDHAGGGLVARGGDLTGFAIAGPDRKFVWADARIEGDSVVVTSPNVDRPAAVRYGWADFPVLNLWNSEGLPASPFRTDEFPHLPSKP